MKKLLKRITGKLCVPIGFDRKKAVEALMNWSAEDDTLKTADRLRGSSKNGIWIHGIQQRSGTVFLGEILRLHPDVHAFPRDVWEVPFLQNIGSLCEFQEVFNRTYPQNSDKIDQKIMLSLLATAFLRYLQDSVSGDKHILLKTPSVQNIGLFHKFFPNETLVVNVRDYRNVIRSKMKTWPDVSFEEASLSWINAGKEIVQLFDSSSEGKRCLVKYEDFLGNDVESAIRRLLSDVGLAESNFPFEEVDKLPVRGSSQLFSKGQVSWDPVSTDNSTLDQVSDDFWTASRLAWFAREGGDVARKLGYAV